MLMDNPIQNYIPDQRGTASFAQRRMGKQRTLLSLIWDYWFQRYCDGKLQMSDATTENNQFHNVTRN